MERGAWLFLVVLFLFSVTTAMGHTEEKKADKFLLQKSKQVIKTEAGEFKVVKGYIGKGVEKPMHIGFITMEPKSLFIPQYLDSSLIIFVRKGEAKIGCIFDDKLEEKQLKKGDLYQISAGSTFYIVNTGQRHRLEIICSVDPSESLGIDVLQSFFIAGGINPRSVLDGFDRKTLAVAFNVSTSELDEILKSQRGGSIIYMGDADEPRRWASFMQKRLKQLHGFEGDKTSNQGDETMWTWRKFMNSVLGKKSTGKNNVNPYNIFDRKPDFKNNYGWSLAVDEDKYPPLSRSGFSVYYVYLTAGSMMVPHINPTASEYGIVTKGSGKIEEVYPNGTAALNAEVKEGDVFVFPRFFSFCQIASRTEPMEFFGFTTSSQRNIPQFLTGANSILRSMNGPEIAMAFGMSQERFDEFINAQDGSIIVPTEPVGPMKTTM